MTRISKSFLLMGTALLALSACSSDKGPGALGSKNDIVVRNNGLPGSQGQPAPVPPSSEGDFSSTVEQGAAVPAPEVAAAEPVAPQEPSQATAPAVEEVARKIEEAKAPVPSTTATSDVVAPEPVATIAPVPAPAPASAPVVSTTPPVGTPVTPPPVQEPIAAAPAPVSVPGPVVAAPAPLAPEPAEMVEAVEPPVPVQATRRSSVYPDSDFPADAPVVSAQTTATTPVTSEPVYVQPQDAAPINPTSPANIKAVQGALKLKGYYKGAETGILDSELLNALSKYQAENKLPLGGLNVDTLRSLGVVQ